MQKADQRTGPGGGQFIFQLGTLGRGKGLFPVLAQPLVQGPKRADLPGLSKNRRRGRGRPARSLRQITLSQIAQRTLKRAVIVGQQRFFKVVRG